MKKLLPILTLLLSLPVNASTENLVVHEWGTFTSFMGSNGELQEGLHHEEEPLPSFVYGLGSRIIKERRDDCPAAPKVPCPILRKLSENRLENQALKEIIPINPLNAGITQKMETPVIYFYGKPEQKVRVEIGFPRGIISQYYPQATSMSPQADQVVGIGPSQFVFDVLLKDVSYQGNIPKTHSESIWNPAREVQANTIQVGRENEKFIFYRGIGDFKTNFTVKNKRGSELTLENLSKEKVPAAFILNSDGRRGIIQALGVVDSKLRTQVPKLSSGTGFANYVQRAKAMIASALEKQGLYKDEALALVNTWEKSYFHTPGIRVLYLVPRIETERILPMAVSPKPKKLVRILVGRIEVMTQTQESEYLELLSEHSEVEIKNLLGRFYEPKLRRLKEVVQKMTDPIKKKQTLKNIQKVLTP